MLSQNSRYAISVFNVSGGDNRSTDLPVRRQKALLVRFANVPTLRICTGSLWAGTLSLGGVMREGRCSDHGTFLEYVCPAVGCPGRNWRRQGLGWCRRFIGERRNWLLPLGYRTVQGHLILPTYILVCAGAWRGGARGAQFPGCLITMGAPNHCGRRQITADRRRVPKMSQILSSIQFICFRKTSGSNMGQQTCFLPHRNLTSLRPWVCGNVRMATGACCVRGGL